MRKYILMNRSNEVALLNIEMEPKAGFIQEMEILHTEYLPFPVRFSKGGMKIDAMESWIMRRMMSPRRFNLENLTSLTGKNLMELSFESYGLTVTDGYWFCPVDRDLKWDDINFFDHDFRYDVGNMIFGIKNSNPDLMSPDLTTNGQMEKTWRKRDGSIWLLKKGSPPYYEEPFNEKAVSKLLEKISKVPFVSYDVVFVCRYAVSICQNFTEKGIEFVSAADIMKTAEKPAFISVDDHLRERCKYLKIPGYKTFLDQIRLLDYIIANYDRHLGNYGFLYDTTRNEFVGPAPIFDNGSSLWCQDSLVKPETQKKLREKSKESLRYIHHPETMILPEFQKGEIRDIVESVYMEAAITSERARAIGNHLAGRYISAREEIERAAEIKLAKMELTQKKEETREL